MEVEMEMEMTCRICWSGLGEGEGAHSTDRKGGGDDVLFSPCNCKGSRLYVHASCLYTWQRKRLEAIDPIRATHCGICLAPYTDAPEVRFSTAYHLCKKALNEIYNVIYVYSGLSLYLYGKILIGLIFAVGLIVGPFFQLLSGAVSLVVNLLMGAPLLYFFQPPPAPRLRKQKHAHIRDTIRDIIRDVISDIRDNVEECEGNSPLSFSSSSSSPSSLSASTNTRTMSLLKDPPLPTNPYAPQF